MDKISRATAILLFWFMVVSIQFPSTIGESQHVDHIQDQKPSLVKTVLDTITSLKESHQDSWGKLKTIIHGIQLKFFPPNLDFRGADERKRESGTAVGGAGDKVKEAVEKSFHTSKETVEETAKTAAEVVGETVHKGAKKVKETVSDKESEAEL
ncbi:uncharacterized protein LOC107425463 [Ziziphus jujuba]|uniref:Uncharacterized protein LOC107425463 n=1 Tax=Ziziphus jujuba TaxID=326968 RepID=A0A6P4AAE5_ZIZJJ|nr:uncharacterized protein LOC107425463 [Ziziphus jujuba]